jgi:hypothetical protein
MVVEDNQASDDTVNADKYLADILNLNDNEILKLPSPYKICKNFRTISKIVSRSLFSSGPTSSSTITLSRGDLGKLATLRFKHF